MEKRRMICYSFPYKCHFFTSPTMKNLKLTLFSFALFSCLGAEVRHASADIVNEFIQVQCLTELNALKIDEFNINGQTPSDYSEKNHQELWQKRAIYPYESLRKIETAPPHSQTALTHKTQCILYKKTGIDSNEKPILKEQVYDIEFGPYLFNTNPEGKCGNAAAFSVSVKTKDKIVIDDLPFLYQCSADDSGQETRSEEEIQTILLLPEEGYINIEGSYLDVEKNNYIQEFKTYWMEEDLPVTARKFYTEDSSH